MGTTILLACALALTSAGLALAAASGEQIRPAIAGNTVQGNMDASGPYAEFYAPDGTIKGQDYTGRWSVEGDAMCFVYPDTPKECWNVQINGDQVRWIKNGARQGTGHDRSRQSEQPRHTAIAGHYLHWTVTPAEPSGPRFARPKDRLRESRYPYYVAVS
jgi:hypothetical protein